jgi:hypothetical protein
LLGAVAFGEHISRVYERDVKNMESVLKSFNFSFLLRSLFAGVFFVLSYWNATGSPCLKPENIFTILAPFALASGVVIYGIHRSIFFPLVEWEFNTERNKRWRVKSFDPKFEFRFSLLSYSAAVAMAKRCDDKGESKTEKLRERAKAVELWADYVHLHLQYTSAWCVFFGAIVGWVVDWKNAHHFNLPLGSLTVVFFAAAAISNWRLYSALDYFNCHEPKGEKGDPANSTKKNK